VFNESVIHDFSRNLEKEVSIEIGHIIPVSLLKHCLYYRML